MSQICKYYLRGTCRYGSRCHFLHEDNHNYGESYSDYSYSYPNRNYSQNYSQRTAYGSHSNKDYSQHYSSRESSQNYSNRDYTYNNNSNKTQHSNYNRNYNRYHVDNRQFNPNEVKDVYELSSTDILDLIKRELKEFEERHIWPFSVIAPLKDLGNIPGFKDFSPEEIRFQYYEACRNNILLHFNQSLNELKQNVIQCSRTFIMDSNKALDIVKKMQRKSGNRNEEEMATDFESNAASSFSFDLRTLDGSFVNGASQSCGEKASNVFSNQQVFNADNMMTSSLNFSLPPSDNTAFTVFNSQPSFSNVSVFGSKVPSNQFELESDSKINSFSFNLNNLAPNQNVPAPSLFSGAVNKNMDDVNNNIYSNLSELSPKTIEMFQTKTFKFGQIPIVPPPKEFCSS